MARWSLARSEEGRRSVDLELPVGLDAFRITGEEASRREVRVIWLQRVGASLTPGRLTGERAVSAGRYGELLLFGTAGGAFFEPGGIWTAGSREAELVIAGEPGRTTARLWIGAGAAATSIEVTAGSFADRSVYRAGERRLIELPMWPGKPLVLRVLAERGFQPSQVDPASADKRPLGARIEPVAAEAGRK
jgi:hypothetical protein